MPPSPPPDFTQYKPTLRRSSSLPVNSLRQRTPSPSMPKIKPSSIELPKTPDTKDMVAIEELSPEAIIPDSVTIYRDPEVELPDERDSTDAELGRKFTEIDLDRMSDDKVSEDGDGKGSGERVIKKVPKKRKYLAVDGVDGDQRQRKKVVSPRDLSPARRVEDG